ncbi:MmpS family transport accessory protein [Nocardia sp. NBC_00403]|uniref:MmpS family transport accessory protein n=1 Tax=Nocardia sp. NBC_00403 TaxID=2975990 RepID=UPI002E1C88FD
MVVLVFGGCVAIIGTAGKEISEAVDAANSSIQAAATLLASVPGPVQIPDVTIPPVIAAPQTGITLVYEIVSDAPTLNSVTYFDHNSELQREAEVAAPWSKSVTNNLGIVIVGVGAQTNGTSVTCRAIVDGTVTDEKTATGKDAAVNCSGSTI